MNVNDPQRFTAYAWEDRVVMGDDLNGITRPDIPKLPSWDGNGDYSAWWRANVAPVARERQRVLRSLYSTKHGYMTLDDCRALAIRCLKRWRCDPTYIVMRDGRGKDRGAACANSYELTLTRASRKPAIVLHEVAHTIAMRVYREANHGPEWMAVYIDLLHTYLNVSKRHLRSTAKDAGLDIARGVYCYGGSRSPDPARNDY